MKKNGFTLIELLAIIVILAIIAVITVPIILNIIDNAEKNSAIDSAYGYKDALQKYYTTKLVQNPEQELPSGYLEISELPSDFTVTGEKPIDGWVKLKKGKVERYSLKYKDYVVTIDNDKNIVSEKQDKVEPHVPNEYQEVEYLESTGTQYINTGIKGESKWQITNQYTTPSDSSQILVGCGESAGQWFGQNNKKYALGTSSDYIYNVSSQTKANILIDFTPNGVSSTIGDETKNRPGSLTNNNYYLFGRRSDSVTFYSYAQIYKAKVYQNNELVRDLVPVIRNDGKPGMLDLANYSDNLWDFFPNTSRSGVTFTSDGKKIILNGTATSSFNIEMNISLKAGTYTLKSNANRVPIDEGTYCIQVYKPNVVLSGVTNKNAVDGTSTFTLNEDTDNIVLRIRAAQGAVYDGFEIIPTLNEGSEALPYESFGYKFYTNAGTGEFIAGPEI